MFLKSFIVQLMGGKTRPPQGLRLNGGKKMQILRAFQEEETNTFAVYGKLVSNQKLLYNK